MKVKIIKEYRCEEVVMIDVDSVEEVEEILKRDYEFKNHKGHVTALPLEKKRLLSARAVFMDGEPLANYSPIGLGKYLE